MLDSSKEAVRQMFEAGMSVVDIYGEFGGEIPREEIYALSPPINPPTLTEVVQGMYVAGKTPDEIAKEVGTIGDVLGVLDHDVQLLVKIPSTIHHAFKARCREYGMTMKEMVVILLDAFLRTDFQ